MIIQGTETLSSFIHIVSESLLTPVMILIVVFLVVVILCIGGLINERISRKPISSEELECLIRNVSFSQSHSEIEKHIEEHITNDRLILLDLSQTSSSKNFELLLNEILNYCDELNNKLSNPLSRSEIRCIAKSISLYAFRSLSSSIAGIRSLATIFPLWSMI